MSSLADLPQLIGFFSYSRNDDEGDDRAVSALSNRIYRELCQQLGRNEKSLKLWRDKDALAAGEHWKEKLKEAVSESVFFIMMVSPSAVKSPFCQFELDSFIKREQALGRDDLVFPILYITVPELEDADTRTDSVLSIVANRQYVDWRPIRYQDANSPEVRRVIGQLCAVIARKLRAQTISSKKRQAIDQLERVEDEQRCQAEEEANRNAEEEERRNRAEAQRRAEEEQSKKEADRLEHRRREQEEHLKPEQTHKVLALGSETAAQIMGWLLVVQASVRVVGTGVLWSTFPHTDSTIFIRFSIAWFVLAAATMWIGYGLVGRKQWVRPFGVAICVVGAINDGVIFAVELDEISRGVSHPNWNFALAMASAIYLLVYLVALIYLWRWYRTGNVDQSARLPT